MPRKKSLRGNAVGLHMIGIKRSLSSQQGANLASRTTGLISSSDDEGLGKGPKLGKRSVSTIKAPVDDMENLTKRASVALKLRNNVPRRLRMRDQFGDLCCNASVKRAKPQTSTVKMVFAQEQPSISLKIRFFRIGTFQSVSVNSVLFTVDCIKIGSDVCIQASELSTCEWCNAQKLPILFFQTTFTGFFKLQLQLQMSKDNSVWLDSNSACPAERYVVVVFEKVLSSQETHVLETIFREIGRASKLENFPTNFPYKEACERLMAIKKMPSSSGSDSLTLSIIDTDDDDDDDQLPQIPTDEVQLIFKGDPGRRLVVYPPPPAKGGISVTEEDLYRLDEGEFLNDVIIDFYLKFLVSEKLQKEDTDRTYIFSSFFFKHLTQEEWRAVLDDENVPMPERRHSRVKTWTRHVDLFQKDFIFVPINMSAHWFLAVICFPGRQNQDVEEQHSGCMDLPPVCEGGLKYLWSDQDICPPNPMSLFYRGSPDYTDINSSTQDNMATFENTINTVKKSKGIHPKPASNEKPCILIMDSLGHYRSSVVKTLQEYLEVEWRTKKGTLRTFQQGAMEGYCPSVPQQDNFSDCGVYLLQYVESFFESPLQSFLAPMDLSHWFPQKVVKKKRYEIRKLILKMHKQQKACKSFQVI